MIGALLDARTKLRGTAGVQFISQAAIDGTLFPEQTAGHWVVSTFSREQAHVAVAPCALLFRAHPTQAFPAPEWS